MPGGRRQPSSHLGKPIGRAIARSRPYPIRVTLAVKRVARVDRRYVHSRYIRPNHPERAIARYGAHIVKALQAVARMARVDRRRVRSLRTRFIRPGVVPQPPQRIRNYLVKRRRFPARTQLRRPVGRAVARAYPYPIRTTLQGTKRAAHPLRRRVRSIRLQPIGRAIARSIAYPIRVILQARMTAARPQRRYVHSKLRRGILAAIVVPLQPILLTIVTRSMAARLLTRDMVLTVATRSMAAVGRTRDMAISIVTRSGSGRGNTRG